MAVQVTLENFQEEVLEADIPVLIDFYASWCIPCRMLASIIEDIAEEVADAKVCKINIDEQPELAQEFQVMSIPTLVVMKNGDIVTTAMGLRPKEKILEMLAI